MKHPCDLEGLCTEIGLSSIQNVIKYTDLLFKENEKTSLTGAKTRYDFIEKHVADVWLAIKALSESVQGEVWDVGSGCGVPGIPLKIFINKLNVRLIESRPKKVEALKRIVNSSSFLNGVLVDERAFEKIKIPQTLNQIWMRAFLPGEKLAIYFSKNFNSKTLPKIILMKGPLWEEAELTAILNSKSVSDDWKERFEKSIVDRYSLPNNLGRRALVRV